jgi:hypothetical protein
MPSDEEFAANVRQYIEALVERCRELQREADELARRPRAKSTRPPNVDDARSPEPDARDSPRE